VYLEGRLTLFIKFHLLIKKKDVDHFRTWGSWLCNLQI
jgi:hypothetical protein